MIKLIAALAFLGIGLAVFIVKAISLWVAGERRKQMATRRAWSEAELDALRTSYPKGIAAAVAATGRTVKSVRNMARKAGVYGKARWTPAEIEFVRDNWGYMRLVDMAKRIGHSADAIYYRAPSFGLRRGAPNGFESFTAACHRTGYEYEQLRAILEWAGVTRRPFLTLPSRTCHHRCHYVEPFDVDEAVKRWNTTEILSHAARRHGLYDITLRRWLRAARASGVEMPKEPRGKRIRWRVPSDTIDAVVAARVALQGAAGETLAHAAKRHDVSPAALAKWLSAGGVERGNTRSWSLAPEAVDAVVVERMKIPWYQSRLGKLARGRRGSDRRAA